MKFGLLSSKRAAKPPPAPEPVELGVVRHDTFLGNVCGWADCKCSGFARSITASQAKAARTWGVAQAVLYPKDYVTCAHCGHGNVWHTEAQPESPKLRQSHQEFRWSFQKTSISAQRRSRGKAGGAGNEEIRGDMRGDMRGDSNEAVVEEEGSEQVDLDVQFSFDEEGEGDIGRVGEEEDEDDGVDSVVGRGGDAGGEEIYMAGKSAVLVEEKKGEEPIPRVKFRSRDEGNDAKMPGLPRTLKAEVGSEIPQDFKGESDRSMEVMPARPEAVAESTEQLDSVAAELEAVEQGLHSLEINPPPKDIKLDSRRKPQELAALDSPRLDEKVHEECQGVRSAASQDTASQPQEDLEYSAEAPEQAGKSTFEKANLAVDVQQPATMATLPSLQAGQTEGAPRVLIPTVRRLQARSFSEPPTPLSGHPMPTRTTVSYHPALHHPFEPHYPPLYSQLPSSQSPSLSTPISHSLSSLSEAQATQPQTGRQSSSSPSTQPSPTLSALQAAASVLESLESLESGFSSTLHEEEGKPGASQGAISPGSKNATETVVTATSRPVSILLTEDDNDEEPRGRARSFAVDSFDIDEDSLEEFVEEEETLSLPARLPIKLTRKVSVESRQRRSEYATEASEISNSEDDESKRFLMI